MSKVIGNRRGKRIIAITVDEEDFSLCSPDCKYYPESGKKCQRNRRALKFNKEDKKFERSPSCLSSYRHCSCCQLELDRKTADKEGQQVVIRNVENDNTWDDHIEVYVIPEGDTLNPNLHKWIHRFPEEPKECLCNPWE